MRQSVSPVRARKPVTAALIVALCLITASAAQETSTKDPGKLTSKSSDASPDGQSVSLGPSQFLSNLLDDQARIWTSPAHVNHQSVWWLLPAAGITAGLIVTDTDVENSIGTSNAHRSQQLSNIGLGAYLGAAGAFYGIGKLKRDPHAQETGFLSVEAATDSLIVGTSLQQLFNRVRPDDRNAGKFWSGGTSFPSNHAAMSWSIASVIAHEYPNWGVRAASYGGATLISLARVSGRKHFPSDVFVGSTVGWLIGREVYRSHHDRQLPGTEVGASESKNSKSELYGNYRDPLHSPSVYVPVDQWPYEAVDRAAALGYVHTAYYGLRPWTRLQFAEIVLQIQEAVDLIGADDVAEIYEALQKEFSPELQRLKGSSGASAEVEEIYSRVTGIAGTPLTDGFHFGQTIYNDYGRPYYSGFNNVTGFAARTSGGPIVLYVRGEYQHAPSQPAYSESVRTLIGQLDQNPVQPGNPISTRNYFRLLEAYTAFNFKLIQFTVGKQDLWWGPEAGGPMLMSNDAEPFYMGRMTNVRPIRIPWLSKVMGPMSFDFFFGQLAGHQFPPGPWTHGQKLTFRPTRNLELGFSRTVVFAGEGHGLTWESFWRSFWSFGDNPSTTPGSTNDVGDRRGGFDLKYRIPGLRDWLTYYADAFTDDDPSPLSAPNRAAFNTGIYLPKFPKLHKLDFRAEGLLSTRSDTAQFHGNFFYWNGAYHDSYTNKENLLGSWVGRQGQGISVESNYWLTGRNRIQVGYRRGMIDQEFVPGGGNINDFRAASTITVRPNFTISGALQYERWNVPALALGAQSNTAVSVKVTYTPCWLWKSRSAPIGCH
jgi:membrane-associated phospholipid phosphatase